MKLKERQKKLEDFEKFSLNGLYGIEEQIVFFALALVNMIFRGDGKSNMIKGIVLKWLNFESEKGIASAEF